MDWENCRKRNIVKEATPDIDFIRSLVKSSNNKMKSEEKLEMTEITASSKLSLAYDSLREVLEALALKRGYKIYNHECYSSFLSEIAGKGSTAYQFNRIRKLRNAANYYGKEITIQEANVVINEIKRIRSEILELVENV